MSQLADSSEEKKRPLSSFVKWMVCIIALIGFAFDIYELLMLPLILRPALQELIGAPPGTPEFEYWRGVLFFVPAIVGGLFGLLGGYLTDLLGPTPCVGDQYFAVCVFRNGKWFCDDGRMVAVFSLHRFHWRVR